jgi:hypothetical protein
MEDPFAPFTPSVYAARKQKDIKPDRIHLIPDHKKIDGEFKPIFYKTLPHLTHDQMFHRQKCYKLYVEYFEDDDYDGYKDSLLHNSKYNTYMF